MNILIKDVADVIVKLTDDLTEDVPSNIKQIVQDEVIRITVDDTRDRGLIFTIASIMDEIEYSNYNIQACMVILVIMMVLLLSIISVVTAQNPNLV